MTGGEAPGFLPGRYPIEAYGRGGFRFAGMSHRGSVLLLPSGVRAWGMTAIADLAPADLAPALAEEPGLEFFLLGTGQDIAGVPEAVRRRFRDAGISFDAMATGSAARTYNVMLAEERRVGAALVAVP